MARIYVTESGTTVVVGDNDTVVIDIPGGGEVTIIADPDDNVDKFRVEFGDDSVADTANIDLSTFSEDDLHIDIRKYDPTDTINLEGAFNRHVDPDDVDEYQFDYIGADGTTYSGFAHAKDGGEKDFTDDPPPIIICFAKGTEIDTIDGPQLIETLQAGDLVRTLDAGFVPVKWLGCTELGASDLKRWPTLTPVRVKRGAFGQGRPEKDVVLSPNHRVLVTGWKAELFFGETEILVPVKTLVDGAAIIQDMVCADTSYFHLLLESHQIVHASGLLSESLFLGDQSLLSLSDSAEQEMRSALTTAEWKKLSVSTAVRPVARTQFGMCMAA